MSPAEAQRRALNASFASSPKTTLMQEYDIDLDHVAYVNLFDKVNTILLLFSSVTLMGSSLNLFTCECFTTTEPPREFLFILQHMCYPIEIDSTHATLYFISVSSRSEATSKRFATGALWSTFFLCPACRGKRPKWPSC